MKVVLVALNSQYVHTALAARSLRNAALKSKAAAAWQIELWEGTINNDWRHNCAALYALKADLYAFSVYIWNADHIALLGERLRQVLPQALQICGGPEVSYDSIEQLAAAPWLDGMLCGEAEESFPAFLSALADNNLALNKLTSDPPLSGWIPQPAHQVARPATSAAMLPIVKDLASLPFAYTDTEINAAPHRIYYYESTRGCPFSCQYCLSAAQRPVRFRPLEQVFQDLDRFIKAGAKQVKFVDRTFNCSPEHCKAIWRYLIRATEDGATTSFHFELAAELIDDEMLAILSGAPQGLFQFEIGVQSTHNATLKAIKRSNNLANIQLRVRQLLSLRRQHLHLDLIAGLPYEAWDASAASFNWVAALRPHMLQLGFLKMLRGSGLRSSAASRGDLYSSYPPYEILRTAWLTHEQLLQLSSIADLVDRFANSGRFRLILQGLERFFASIFGLYEHLALFWQEREYGQVSREAVNYLRLLEFAATTAMSREEALCRLACDFCLFHRDENLPAPLDEAICELTSQQRRALRNELNNPASTSAKLVYRQFPSLTELDAKTRWRQLRVERFLYDPDTLIEGVPKLSEPETVQLFLLTKDRFGNRAGHRITLSGF